MTNQSQKLVLVLSINNFFYYFLLGLDFSSKLFLFQSVHKEESKRIRFLYFDNYCKVFNFRDESKRSYD